LFDLAFSELFVVALVALVVIGPERLPGVAKKGGQWISKMRRYVDDVKGDFSRQADLAELRKFKDDVTSAATSFKDSVQSSVSDVNASVDSLNQSLTDTIGGDMGPALTEPDSAATDWDKIWALRRTRDKIKDRRKERQRELGLARNKYSR
jgi:sec-independent protein translocase protein TatB